MSLKFKSSLRLVIANNTVFVVFTKWKKSYSLSHTGWNHQTKQVTQASDESARLGASEMLIRGKTNRESPRWSCGEGITPQLCLNEIQKSPPAILHYGHACVCECAHVWDLVYVSLRSHTSLVCIGMWLMTFINGSEQGLGPLQCCLLSPLLFSNDFLATSFPQGWPCHSNGLLFLFPSFLIHALTQNTQLSLTLTQMCTMHTHLARRHPVCVCVCVSVRACVCFVR